MYSEKTLLLSLLNKAIEQAIFCVELNKLSMRSSIELRCKSGIQNRKSGLANLQTVAYNLKKFMLFGLQI